MNDISMKIEIPTDNDGFLLLQCPLCGEYFKITPSDYEDDGVLEIFCPNCGLVDENYLTEDVVKLAMVMTHNVGIDLVYDEMKKWERKFNGGLVSFKVGKKPAHEYENPIHATIEALMITHFRCCEKSAKIKPVLKISGCYCPFCGVKDFEVE